MKKLLTIVLIAAGIITAIPTTAEAWSGRRHYRVVRHHDYRSYRHYPRYYDDRRYYHYPVRYYSYPDYDYYYRPHYYHRPRVGFSIFFGR